MVAALASSLVTDFQSALRAGLKDILLNHTNLYEDLRNQGSKNEP
jgi:hypothetical protein